MSKPPRYYDKPPSVGVIFGEPTMTPQNFAAEVDINNIVKRAISTQDYSVLQPVDRQHFFDTSDFTDYHSTLDTLNTVSEDFQGLPSAIRRRFNDDVSAYVSFMSNPENFKFGVVSPDSRVQRPEYLGGGTVTVNINPVVQNSSANDTSPQGNLAAYGVSGSYEHGFSHSFVEHSIVIGLLCVRADLTY